MDIYDKSLKIISVFIDYHSGKQIKSHTKYF